MLGTTTPLFALFLAALARLGLEPQVAAIGVGIAADLGVIFLLWRFGRTTIGPTAGLLASLVYALMTPTAAHAVSGMETSLYLLLILLAFHLAQNRRAVLCAGMCGLLVWLRPDGLLVVASVAGWAVWRRFGDKGWPGAPRDWVIRTFGLVRQGWLAGLAFGVVLGPWVLVAWRYFGSPVPQSLVAKWELPVDGPLASVRYFTRYFLDLDERWFLPLTVLAVVGLLADLRHRPALYPLLGWGGAYAAAFLASNKFVYPLYPFEWYFLPLMLPYSLAIAAGWTCVVASIGKLRGYNLLVQRQVHTALAVLFVVSSLGHLDRERSQLAQYVGGREQLYFRLAEQMARYGVVDDVVAGPEIGAFGHVYPGPLLDLHGLITPAAVGRSFGEVLRDQRPPWYVSYDTLVPNELTESAWFQQHYRPVAVLENWETRKLALFRWYPEPAPTRAVGPILGGTLELVGRRLWWEETRKGRYLRVELTWRARQAPTSRTTISVQLVDDDGTNLAQQDSEPQQGTRPTTTWRAGELIVDRYDLAVSELVGQKARWLAIIGYRTESPGEQLDWHSAAGAALGARLHAPLPPAGGAQTGDRALLPCHAVFAGGIRLAGFEARRDGDRSMLRLLWETSAVLKDDYTVFVHFLDGRGQIVAQADGPPAGGKMLTSVWEPGDRLVETRTAAGPGTAARAMVGLYLPPGGPRLARADAAGDSAAIVLGPPARCE